MAVCNGINELPKVPPGFLFRQATLLCQVSLKATACYILHDDDEMTLCCVHLYHATFNISLLCDVHVTDTRCQRRLRPSLKATAIHESDTACWIASSRVCLSDVAVLLLSDIAAWRHTLQSPVSATFNAPDANRSQIHNLHPASVTATLTSRKQTILGCRSLR